MTEIEERVERIEQALVALGVLQFGEDAGHPFRGNQYSGGGGSERTPGEIARSGNATQAEKDRLNARADKAQKDVEDNRRQIAAEEKSGLVTGDSIDAERDRAALAFYKDSMGETSDPEVAREQLDQELSDRARGSDAEVQKNVSDMAREIAAAAYGTTISAQADPAYKGSDMYGIRLAGPEGKNTIAWDAGGPPDSDEFLSAIGGVSSSPPRS